ncbi:GntR family transcriptional regulator [Reinekea blandensis]|uniref:Putative GntR family transcriptional regulator n=1 Tax=Reinekea blandensis MED297 TaxID=314283 RepID=A4BG55_9GAMM|nr:GntR family transcriptional regulator [Reinekea blandensis]EAR08850.1 putative GntR family transcriptional regulator [Reinekea sp. MED297] [Reinekea blandensis MED297]
MTRFDNSSAIYLQIADLMCEKILTGEWPGGERIPSIREVAALVQANPNTVMRSFAHLQEEGILYNRRGVGYFVADDGKERVQSIRRQSFIHTQLPKVFREARLLGLSPNELTELYQQYSGDDHD